MRKRLTIISALAAVGFGAWLGITVARGDANYLATNSQSLYVTNFQWLTITNSWGTPFLTISNRPYVQFEGGSCVVRVTDAEWQSITNHYADKIKTNSITFYGK